MADSRHLPVLEAALVGAFAGLSAVILSVGISWLGSLRIALSDSLPSSIVLPAFGFVGGMLAGAVLIVRPEASGSGIPQVRAIMTRLRVRLDISVALLKLFGGVIALGCGLFLGREGPTVQVGAGVAAQLCKAMPSTQAYRRQIIAAGAAAGLAAAFSAPLAAIVFVIEELTKEFSATTVGLALIACFSASLVEHLLSKPHVIAAESARLNLDLSTLAALLTLALICGLFGAVFNRGILWSLRCYSRISIPKAIQVAIAGLVTGAVVSMLPQVMHNYAATRTLINTGSLDPQIVPGIFVCFFLLTLLAYGSGSPGGLFAPCLAIGSTLGFMVGDVTVTWWHFGNVSAFSLVGMAAFFAAVARAPLTAIVIVFEMTGNYGLVLPLILCSTAASSIADRIEPGGLYEHLMIWNGLHVDTRFGDKRKQALTVSDLIRTDVPTVQAQTSLQSAIRLLTDGSDFHNKVPVLSGNTLVGIFSTDAARDQDLTNIRVSNVMQKNPLSVAPHDSIDELLQLFARRQLDWIPVARMEIYLGIVTRADLVRTLFGDSTSEDVSLSPDAVV